MNHQDALREMSVERYLLGELTGEPRDLFEEHLFDCQECTADLTSGVTLLRGVRDELASSPTRSLAKSPARRTSGRFEWLLNPAWLVPALAACLLFLLFQTFVVVPGMRRQLAQVETPSVLHDLVLAGGAARGDKTLKIVAQEHGFFLLSVDIPTSTAHSSYRCSLYAPSGALVWRGDISSEQAKDTVQIHVPAAVTEAGGNRLLIQGVRQDDPSGAKLDDLVTHRFFLELQK